MNRFRFVPEHYAARDHQKMQEVLLYPEAEAPAIHYYMLRGGHDQRNITVWEPGTVGGEYIKTYGHYHLGELDETYWVLYGQGIALAQKRALDSDGNPLDDVLESFTATPVKQGDQLYFGAGHAHLVANTGSTYLVTADDSPVQFGHRKDEASLPGHADYTPVKHMRGFAYYLVEHQGRPALVKNPRYRQITTLEVNQLPILDTL